MRPGTHLAVNVDVDDVRLVNEHIDERRLAVMQVTDDRDVPDCFRVRSQAHQEPVSPCDVSASSADPPSRT